MISKIIFSFVTYIILAIIPLKTCTLVEPQAIENNAAQDSVRILALGDSYTIGQSVEQNLSWPNQIKDSLESNNIKVIETRIIARTGWTTEALKHALEGENFDVEYDVVGLLIGVNNQFQGLSISDYKVDFEYLLNKAISLAGYREENVFVLSIPDYGVTPVGRNYGGDQASQEIDEFNKVNFEIAKKYKITYFDVTGISRTARHDSQLIARDGLHFSGKMYTKWVQLILPYILSQLISN
jgi:lysophospholipase L1-like esterase